MKTLRTFFGWCSRWAEMITLIGVAILILQEERTSFEYALAVLLVGIMGSVMKLRIYLQGKEDRDNNRN